MTVQGTMSDELARRNDLETALLALTPEAVAVADELLTALEQRVRELRRRFNAQLVERIEQCGNVTVGDWLWTTKAEKSEKVRESEPLVVELFEACDGDLTRFAGTLAAGWAKPGTIRRLLAEAGRPEAFDRHFETVVKVAPEKKPSKVNLKYAGGAR